MCAFGVGQACLPKVFVADLKLGTHELNEAHFVHEEHVGFLENLDVRDGLPNRGREANLQRDVPESGVDGVEGREARGCFVVCEGETRGLPRLALVLASPGSLILVRCDRGGYVPQAQEGGWTTQTGEEFPQEWVKAPWKLTGAVKDGRGRRGVREVAEVGEERLAHRGSPDALLLAAHIGVGHSPHHLRLGVEGPERPM